MGDMRYWPKKFIYMVMVIWLQSELDKDRDSDKLMVGFSWKSRTLRKQGTCRLVKDSSGKYIRKCGYNASDAAGGSLASCVRRKVSTMEFVDFDKDLPFVVLYAFL